MGKKNIVLLIMIFILAAGCDTSAGDLRVSDLEPATELAHTEVDEILRAHLEATGGLERWRSIRNIVISGIFEIPGYGVSGSTRIVMQTPNLFFIETNMNMFKTYTGHDGDQVWLFDNLNGVRVLAGDERTHYLAQGAMDRLWRWWNYYSTAILLPDETVDGKLVKVIRFLYAGGGFETFYFNANTHNLVRIEGSMISPEGIRPIITDFKDFQTVEGLIFPMREVSRLGGIEMSLIKTSIAIDAPIEQSYGPPSVLKKK